MLPRGMFTPFVEVSVQARSRHFVLAVALAHSLLFAACSAEQEAAPAAQPSAQEASAAAASPSTSAADTKTLAAATIDFADGNCSAVRRKLEYCPACETDAQKPNRDLLLAYCAERENPAAARALYDALITAHPNTEAAVLAVMRVRQIDAAELPPLSEYGGPKPTPLDRPQPAYPSLAAQAGVEGKVRLRFDVREDGGISNARVVEATPPLLFDSVALYAVTSWKYEPGRAAESQQITLRFELPDEEIAAARQAAGAPPLPPAAGEVAR